MKKAFVILISLMVLLAAYGCEKKAVIKSSEQTASEIEAQKAAAEAQRTADAQKAADAKAAAEAQKEADAQKAAEAAMAKGDRFKDIHFDYDRFAILDADKPMLKDLASFLKYNKAAKVQIEGNCDERGTNEYNLALGDRRARAAKDVLVSSGVSSSRIKTVSYGEEKPICTEHEESCWFKNRRDHFAVSGAN